MSAAPQLEPGPVPATATTVLCPLPRCPHPRAGTVRLDQTDHGMFPWRANVGGVNANDQGPYSAARWVMDVHLDAHHPGWLGLPAQVAITAAVLTAAGQARGVEARASVETAWCALCGMELWPTGDGGWIDDGYSSRCTSPHAVELCPRFCTGRVTTGCECRGSGEVQGWHQPIPRPRGGGGDAPNRR